MKNIFTSYEEAALFIKQIIHKKSNHYMKVWCHCCPILGIIVGF
jgi:hypothetical protein